MKEHRVQGSIWAQICPCHGQRFNSDLPSGANVVFTPMLLSGCVITESFPAQVDDQYNKVGCSLAVTGLEMALLHQLIHYLPLHSSGFVQGST